MYRFATFACSALSKNRRNDSYKSDLFADGDDIPTVLFFDSIQMMSTTSPPTLMAADEYESLPFNGLATSSDILREQTKRLGITEEELEMLPDVTDAKETTATDGTTQKPQQPQLVYDGPVDTKKTIGEMLSEYGFPESAAGLVSSAEDAIIGIPKDLGKAEEPVWTILTKDARLQGLGALAIIVAAIIGLINLLR
jgi:hypothetical protein